MTEQRTRMKIGIDGKVYTLDTSIQKSLTQIPWESRKKVIAVLEAMKQAEHVEKPRMENAPIEQSNVAKPMVKTAVKPAVKPAVRPVVQSPPVKSKPTEINETDPDLIMQQFIMQQPSHNIPDRMTAIKWIAIFFAVVISLAILI